VRGGTTHSLLQLTSAISPSPRKKASIGKKKSESVSSLPFDFLHVVFLKKSGAGYYWDHTKQYNLFRKMYRYSF
jgi:hypothetical protein